MMFEVRPLLDAVPDPEVCLLSRLAHSDAPPGATRFPVSKTTRELATKPGISPTRVGKMEAAALRKFRAVAITDLGHEPRMPRNGSPH